MNRTTADENALAGTSHNPDHKSILLTTNNISDGDMLMSSIEEYMSYEKTVSITLYMSNRCF
jgi:hypothetical protein